MALPTFTEDMDIIAALSDRPNTDDGLTANQLKAKFDIAGNKIKTFLNTLIPLLMEKQNVTGMVKATSGVLSAAVAGTDYQSPLIFDNTPTASSNNPVKSGGVYTALAGKSDTTHNHSGVYEPVLATEQKRRIFIQSTQPSNPVEGDIWIKV